MSIVAGNPVGLEGFGDALVIRGVQDLVDRREEEASLQEMPGRVEGWDASQLPCMIKPMGLL